jgi:flagellar protein FlaF
MQHAAQAYKNVAKETLSARELEASLLLKAAAQFQAIFDGWERRKPELNDALLFNRKLWTFFLESVTRDDNPLPINIRQNVASLGMFVIGRTIRLTSDPKPEGLGTLININRNIASGLRSKPQPLTGAR